MDSRALVDKARPRLQKAFDFLLEELRTIRSGRATPSLIDELEVNVYGQPMKLKQLAAITVPDATSLSISPWDPNSLEAIEKAIRDSKELGFNPVNDGKVIHINVPPLTAERREQMVKQIGDKVENSYIALRNIRHEVLNEAKRGQKDKQLSEDDYHLVDKQISRLVDDLRGRIVEVADAKRAEIRQI